MHKELFAHLFSVLLGLYLGVELLSYMVILCLTFWGFSPFWKHFEMCTLIVNTSSSSRILCQLQCNVPLSPQHDTSSPLMVTPPSAEAHWAVRVSDRGRRPSAVFHMQSFSHLWRSEHFIGRLYHPLCCRVSMPQKLDKILFQIRVFAKAIYPLFL